MYNQNVIFILGHSNGGITQLGSKADPRAEKKISKDNSDKLFVVNYTFC